MKRPPVVWRYDYLYCTDRMEEKDAYPMFFIGTRDEWNEYVKNEVGLWGACPFSVTRRKATPADIAEMEESLDERLHEGIRYCLRRSN